jgi:hypothetical protein
VAGKSSLKRTAALSLLAITLVALSLPIIGPFLIFPAVVPVLVPILPRPNHVPPDATATYEWKASGMHWRWRSALEHGSAAWSATDRYAQVSLYLDTNTLRYLTFEDAVVFSTGTSTAGRPSPVGGGDPCPFSISAAEVARFQQLVSEAIAQAEAKGERAILHRIALRLSVANGAALTSYTNGQGCSDLSPEDYRRPRRDSFDPLTNVR